MRRFPAGTLMTMLVLHGCGTAGGGAATPTTPPQAIRPGDDTAWLSGSVDERFARVAKHLRGLDVAMVETGYRYGELYWAGEDGNWAYAEYQLRKIQTAIANGVERRPRRAQSARMLDGAVQQVSAAIKAHDGAAFTPAFAALTNACNACHQAENVAFITVRVPTDRPPLRLP